MSGRKIRYKCPHCGWIFGAAKSRDGLVPPHWMDPDRKTERCQGSGQTPRGLGDRRPLWSGPPGQTYRGV